MKILRVFGLAFLMLFSSAVYSVTASGVATLPAKCVGVKKQVRAFEKMEKPLAVEYAPVNGKWTWYFATDKSDSYIDLQKTIVELQVKMFTFNSANLNCFSPTQREYATFSLKNWKDIQSNLEIRPNWVAGFSFLPLVWDSIYSK